MNTVTKNLVDELKELIAEEAALSHNNSIESFKDFIQTTEYFHNQEFEEELQTYEQRSAGNYRYNSLHL